MSSMRFAPRPRPSPPTSLSMKPLHPGWSGKACQRRKRETMLRDSSSASPQARSTNRSAVSSYFLLLTPPPAASTSNFSNTWLTTDCCWESHKAWERFFNESARTRPQKLAKRFAISRSLKVQSRKVQGRSPVATPDEARLVFSPEATSDRDRRAGARACERQTAPTSVRR